MTKQERVPKGKKIVSSANDAGGAGHCVYIQWNTTQQCKNEILSLATMWMELDGIMVSEISQSEKDRCHIFSLICGI